MNSKSMHANKSAERYKVQYTRLPTAHPRQYWQYWQYCYYVVADPPSSWRKMTVAKASPGRWLTCGPRVAKSSAA